jgi:PAAR motif
MPMAARIDDRCIHLGAKLATGSPDTIVGGQKQSRLGDISLGCEIPIPAPPHKVGHLVKCSMTVFVNGLGAARVGDKLICPSPPPTPGPPGGPRHAVKRYETVDADNYVAVLYVDGRTGEYNDPEENKVQIGVFEKSRKGEDYKVKVDVLNVTASGSAGKGAVGFGASAEGKASVLTVEGSKVLAGTAENPYLQVLGTGDVGEAEGKADILVGSDGKRVGLGGTLKGGLTPAQVEGKVKVGIPLPKKLSFQVVAGATAAVPGPSAGVGGAVYFDKKEKRVHIAASFDIAGFGISFDVSLGMRFGLSVPMFGIDAVAFGCTTVFIGG